MCVVVLNLTPVPRHDYRVGLPRGGRWAEALNSDSEHYGGSNVGNMGGVDAESVPWHGQPWSAEMTLPPLGVVWFALRNPEAAAAIAGVLLLLGLVMLLLVGRLVRRGWRRWKKRDPVQQLA